MCKYVWVRLRAWEMIERVRVYVHWKVYIINIYHFIYVFSHQLWFKLILSKVLRARLISYFICFVICSTKKELWFKLFMCCLCTQCIITSILVHVSHIYYRINVYLKIKIKTNSAAGVGMDRQTTRSRHTLYVLSS